MISLMPGPVEISDEIDAAFHLPPISHRSREFVDRFEAIRAKLCAMTGATFACLLNGSGTLANEAIASCLEGPGLVLVNGEFGERLVRQARGWDLSVRVLEWPWGVPWDLDRIAGELGGVQWVWAVHLETSTGMLNDVVSLSSLAQEHGVRLCLDCISSLGAVPLDLREVWLASGVSGKALGSYSGIAMVLASDLPRSARSVPVYLDLTTAMRTEGPCFTFSSPLLLALDQTLDLAHDYAPLGCLVRRRLRELGVKPMVDESLHAPVVATFCAPAPDFVERCRSLGYWIGGESAYLAARGLVQIANMGAVNRCHIDDFFEHVSFQAG